MTRLPRRSKYLQVADHIRLAIRRRGLAEGDPLPTDNDLAGELGCSLGTVRKAMTLLARARAVTRRPGAGTFVGKRPGPRPLRSFAAIFRSLDSIEQGRLAQLATWRASVRGCRLFLGVTNGLPELERHFIETIADKGADGVIKHVTDPAAEPDMRALLRAHGLPYVVVNDFWTDTRTDHHVTYDECAAVEMAVEHVARLGHERIVLLDSDTWTRARAIDAFLGALARLGLPSDERHVSLCDAAHRPAFDAIYCQDGPNPTAIVTVCATTALNTIDGLSSIEKNVPGDVSVVNLDGRPFNKPYDRDLTTVIPPTLQMIDTALDLLDNPTDPDRVSHQIFKPGFQPGCTTAPRA